MTVKVSKGKTIGEVVKGGLCTGCGTCVGICPMDAIEMVIEHKKGIYIPQLDEEKCNQCGLCFEVCPGHAVDFKQLNLDIFGREPEDVLLGNYLNCYIGHATDYDIRYNSASGGLVTALLIFALEEGVIDGALVTRMREDRPLEPQPFVARTKEEIISAAKSKYCPVPANIALKEILESKEGERFAVVGVPCHIHGIRKAESVNKKLKEKIVYHLGLFCSHTDTFLHTDFFLQKCGVKKEDVARFDYRGQGWPGSMRIQLRDGTAKVVPYLQGIIWHGLGFSIPECCMFCSDALAELADMSFGDAWGLRYLKDDKAGKSIFLSRSEMAEQLLRNMISKGHAEARKTQIKDQVRSSQILLYEKKKASIARSNLFRKNMCSPDYCLAPDILDYLFAMYQRLNISLMSKPFFARVLKHVPMQMLRLYNMFLAVIPAIQMTRVRKKRY